MGCFVDCGTGSVLSLVAVAIIAGSVSSFPASGVVSDKVDAISVPDSGV
jgi:hypothetical protein